MSTIRLSIKNRFCDKKSESRTCFDLLLDKHARNKPTFAMRALFRGRKKKNSPRKKEKEKEGKRGKREKGQAIRAALTFALSRRKSRDSVVDATRIFHVCLKSDR